MSVQETTITGVSAGVIDQSLQHIEVPQDYKEVAQPPLAKKVRIDHELHGDKRPDDYHWMRNKEDPSTIPYLEEWNHYTMQSLEPISGLTEKLFEEFKSRIEPNDHSVPYRIGTYEYYIRMEENKEHPIYCRKPATGGKEEIILDGNEYAKSVPFFNVTTTEPSPNGKYVAFTIDTDGSQFGKIVIKDMVKGTFLDDEEIPKSDGEIIWNSMSTGIWYAQVNEEMRADKVRFHSLGNSPENDPVIIKEDDPLFDLGIWKDKLDRRIFICAVSKETSEVKYGPLDDIKGELKTIHSREKGLKYTVIPGENEHYIRYSRDRKNWGLMTMAEEKMTSDHWIPFMPPDDSVDIDDVEVFKDFLVLIKRHSGLLQIEVRNLKDSSHHTVTLPQDICEISLEHNDDFDTNKLRFFFSSPVTPNSVYSYDMENKELKLLKQSKAGNFDPKNYTVERVWAPAEDGTSIPITVFHKKGLEKDGTAPMYLYGYGSYGITYDPYFSNVLASYLERGVSCAIAHIRGGGDLGRQWYELGAMLKKRNTFTDFINSAEFLIKQGYTSPNRLAIRGGSAGGLLMGAVVNMRPDLFKACLAEVPFVDVVTTMLDESLPLTTQEWSEWGNPNKKGFYEYMKSYSPYDNVKAQEYPSIFVTAGLNDAQVSYHEPAKWVAKLLEFKTDSNPLLFRTNMGAGHHGASGRYEAYAELAPLFAFLLDQIGVKE